ncbi:hypothetical protein TgHK011_004610 [Trichoderma gracile]|nr:hypothetical protein TgHK011_004610 [Trichoderma gracile]
MGCMFLGTASGLRWRTLTPASRICGFITRPAYPEPCQVDGRRTWPAIVECRSKGFLRFSSPEFRTDPHTWYKARNLFGVLAAMFELPSQSSSYIFSPSVDGAFLFSNEYSVCRAFEEPPESPQDIGVS